MTPAEFREVLQRQGRTFIKIGQFLALRPDLLPQDYCDELLFLEDRIAPLPWTQARTILEEDLGAPLAELFAIVNPRPVAAGSLAQTHAGRLRNGTEVAIKIQRPDLRPLILRDLERPQMLENLLESSGVSLLASPREIVGELRDWVLRELDFTNERANVARLHRLTVGSCLQKVPRPYPELCGSRVLTLEYLRGIRVSEWLLDLRADRHGDNNWPEGVDLDRRAFAENLVTAILTQIFEYHFFHAGLHPGNLLALPDNVVGFVDFGLCDEVDMLAQERQMRYISAVFGQDPAEMFSPLTDLLTPSQETDLDAFRRDFLAEVRVSRAKRANMSGDHGVASDEDRSPIGEGMIAVMRVARRHGLHMPPGIHAMYRTLLAAERIAHQLGTDANIRSVGQQFFTRLQREYTLRALAPERIQSISLSLLDLSRDAHGEVPQLLAELSGGQFVLNAYASESTRTASHQNRRVRMIVMSIVWIGIAILLTGPALPRLFGISSAWPLSAALLLALCVWIYIQWRRLG